MMRKKTYIQPETAVITIDTGCLLITASGGSNGEVNLTYDTTDGDAYNEGLSRKDIFDSDDDYDDDYDSLGI